MESSTEQFLVKLKVKLWQDRRIFEVLRINPPDLESKKLGFYKNILNRPGIVR